MRYYVGLGMIGGAGIMCAEWYANHGDWKPLAICALVMVGEWLCCGVGASK